MKNQIYLKSLILGIFLFNTILVVSMQQNKVFRGIINNTDKQIELIIGKVTKPLLSESVPPHTAKLKEVMLESDSTYEVFDDATHATLKLKPTYQEFIILVEPGIHESIIRKEIKVE